MFNILQNSLFGPAIPQNRTLTDNGAEAYSYLEGPDGVLATQFGVVGNFVNPRKAEDIFADMKALWDENPENCVKFAFYTRMITRKATYLDGTKTKESQKGMELKNEGIFRLIWLAINHPEVFWKNVELIPVVGSWKDVFQMLSFDLQYHGWENRKLDWDKFGTLICAHLSNPNTNNLIKKYLPSIKSRVRCTTLESQADNLIGKWICSLLFGNKEGYEASTYKKYRKLKTSGTAHDWQKLISRKQFASLEFGSIPGKALSKLVKSKFLLNQGLQQAYEQWIVSQLADGNTVKATEYVCEVFKGIHRNSPEHVLLTADLKFKELLNKAKDNKPVGTNLIPVIDISSSMGVEASIKGITILEVAKTMTLFMSEMMDGPYKGKFISFSRTAALETWEGTTPTEKYFKYNKNYIGNTAFEGVLNTIAVMYRNGVAEKDLPTGIVCFSDLEFDPGSLSSNNVKNAKRILSNAGLSTEYVDKFSIILWNLSDRKKFHTGYTLAPNTMYLSGLSPANLSFVLDLEVLTARDLALKALNQEILNLIRL